MSSNIVPGGLDGQNQVSCEGTVHVNVQVVRRQASVSQSQVLTSFRWTCWWETEIREERLVCDKSNPTNLWIWGPPEYRGLFSIVGRRTSGFVVVNNLRLRGAAGLRRRLILGIVARGRNRSLLMLHVEPPHINKALYALTWSESDSRWGPCPSASSGSQDRNRVSVRRWERPGAEVPDSTSCISSRLRLTGGAFSTCRYFHRCARWIVNDTLTGRRGRPKIIRDSLLDFFLFLDCSA